MALIGASQAVPAVPRIFKKKDLPAVHGRVALADGSFPWLPVELERVCKGIAQSFGYAGNEGRFTMDGDALGEAPGCEIRAHLDGYRSQSVPLPRASAGEDASLGILILRPRGKDDAQARSGKNTELLNNKNARRAFEAGLDSASRGKLRDAELSFRDTVTFFTWASPAWFCVGLMEQREGDPVAAKKAFKDAIAIDSGWLLPYAYVLPIEVARQEWQEALHDSETLIHADALAFPGAYAANAWANMNLHNVDAAEKSAREAIRLDTEHRYSDMEYVLGLLSIDKVDPAAAKQHLEAYLKLAPDGANANAAREQLKQLAGTEKP